MRKESNFGILAEGPSIYVFTTGGSHLFPLCRATVVTHQPTQLCRVCAWATARAQANTVSSGTKVPKCDFPGGTCTTFPPPVHTLSFACNEANIRP